MNVKQLQEWINQKIKEEKLALQPLITDGQGGPLTRSTFILLFANKNAKAITEEQKLALAKQLGDTSTKRISAVAQVETSGAGWTDSGLPKILYERHYFHKFVKKTIKWLNFGLLSDSSAGGYTIDADKNGINDNWDKLAAAVCIDPMGALQSISIGSFQVMGKWYKDCGYAHPIDMLWDARNSELGHYKMLVGFIKANNLTKAFLSISTTASTNVAFVRAYNGPAWQKNDYANKLAKAMR